MEALIAFAVGVGVGWLIGAHKGRAALVTARKVWDAILAKEHELTGKLP